MRRSSSPVRSGGRLAGVGLLACAPVAATIWLFLAALPVLADGGPHVSTINNGSLGINADSCAGCHRAHTAQGPMLLKAADEEALCLTCHGSAGVGATTDVLTGVQYKVALPPGSAGQDPTNASVLLGALRNGGFDQARIDAGNAARLSYFRNAAFAVSQRPKVGVGAPEDVNSAHLALPDNGLTMPGIAWGNGANGSGAGPAVDLSCASCHNPHGNGQYRILNAIPNPTATSGTFTPAAANAVVTDSPPDNPDPAESDTKNYTVIQTKGTQGDDSTYLLYADDVLDAAYGPTAGDYFHRYVPWSQTSAVNRTGDAPNGAPSTFNTQITAWCTTCHTRYYSLSADDPRLDAIYKFQHETVSNRACTTCHVSHGSNAATATGAFSSTVAYPNGTASASSRLLKIDNRGTCQACHDPTHTVPANSYTGPLPTPGVP